MAFRFQVIKQKKLRKKKFQRSAPNPDRHLEQRANLLPQSPGFSDGKLARCNRRPATPKVWEKNNRPSWDHRERHGNHPIMLSHASQPGWSSKPAKNSTSIGTRTTPSHVSSFGFLKVFPPLFFEDSPKTHPESRVNSPALGHVESAATSWKHGYVSHFKPS